MSGLEPAEQRVADAAAALGLAVTIRKMAQSTRTADEAAAACGAPVGAIVKSLVFRGKASGRPLLLLVSGANRVDEAAVAAHIGEAIVRPDAQFVREVTGYAIGGVPPLGHNQPLATYFDAALLEFAEVFAAAGTPRSMFAVSPQALAAATEATIIAVT